MSPIVETPPEVDLDRVDETPDEASRFGHVRQRVESALFESLRAFFSFIGRLLLLLLSIEPLVLAAMAPLSALLLTFPVAMPDESVIADTVPATGTEDDFRRNEFTQLVETLAHWKACFYCFGR